MKIDVAMELAKNEIINSINEVSKKYNLPSCLLNIIIQVIGNEISKISQEELLKNMEEYNKEKNKDRKKEN